MTPLAPSPAGCRFAGYELLGELGRGGMGVVYRARDLRLGRLVALKMMLPGACGSVAAGRFITEARAAAGLDHPNIVPVFEAGDWEGTPYFTMAYVEGISLGSRLKQGGPLPAREAAALAADVADAITAAHRAGIIHRDLKPDNILIDSSGRPRVTDFGLAKQLGEAGVSSTGSVLGTPAYMAPEQVRGDIRALGPHTDVYALGGLLYALLGGRPPFSGDSTFEVLQKAVSDPPPPLTEVRPDVPPALEAVCQRCLQKDPADRYPSAAAVAEALRAWLALCPAGSRTFGTHTDATVTDVNRRSLPARQPRRWVQRVLAASAVGAVGAAVLFLSGKHLPEGKSGLTPVDPGTATGIPAVSAAVGHDPFDNAPMPQGFRLKADLVGGKPAAGGTFALAEGQEIALRLESERDAYVAVWSMNADGTMLRLFPNEYEPDHFLPARTPRVVPGGRYRLQVENVGAGREYIHVIASTARWEPVSGGKQGPFTVFQSPEERQRGRDQIRTLRGIKIVPWAGKEKAKPAPAEVLGSEVVLFYTVEPRR